MFSRKLILGVFVILACLTASTMGQSSAKKVPQPGGRAMWVWGGIDYSSATSYNKVLSFMQAPFGYPFLAIDRMILYAGSSMLSGTKATQMRAFLKEAHNRNIVVEYLDGDAQWTTSAAKAQSGKAVCSNVVAFNKGTADTTDDFDGVHMDIEPHVLGATWTSNSGRGKDAYNDDVEDNLLDIYRSCYATIAAGDSKMTLAADIAYWYVSVAQDIWNGFMKDQSVDYLTIMDYTDQQAAFQRNALQNLNAVTGGKIKIVVGVESIDEASAPAAQSFWQEGYGPLESQLATTKANIASNAAFGGFAIHHYGSYVSLPYDKTGRAGAVPATWSKARSDYPTYGKLTETSSSSSSTSTRTSTSTSTSTSTRTSTSTSTSASKPTSTCVCRRDTNKRAEEGQATEFTFVEDSNTVYAVSSENEDSGSNLNLILAAAAGWGVALVATVNMILSERKRRALDLVRTSSN